MDPLTIGMTAGAVLGAAKSIDGSLRANHQRKAQAAATRYSPWTGMQGQAVQEPSPFGDIATGVAAGAAIGQGIKGAQTPDANAVDSLGAMNGGPSDKMSVMGQGQSMDFGAAPQMMGGSAGALGGQSPWMQMNQNPDYFTKMLAASSYNK